MSRNAFTNDHRDGSIAPCDDTTVSSIEEYKKREVCRGGHGNTTSAYSLLFLSKLFFINTYSCNNLVTSFIWAQAAPRKGRVASTPFVFL